MQLLWRRCRDDYPVALQVQEYPVFVAIHSTVCVFLHQYQSHHEPMLLFFPPFRDELSLCRYIGDHLPRTKSLRKRPAASQANRRSTLDTPKAPSRTEPGDIPHGNSIIPSFIWSLKPSTSINNLTDRPLPSRLFLAALFDLQSLGVSGHRSTRTKSWT